MKGFLNTYPGAGLTIVALLLLVCLAGCQPEPDSIAWTAETCGKGAGCYR